ncbi:solute carrier family 22 member 18 isoform X1 [Neoarius graeffei]|uniref:solute carrier family 22 member 18 isoform X1 n=1 Tax=Neoarius graeffei TaxID=443677 RepID=UPI00298C47E3|nr:solute carrier family 22 member 18 isoform X1 [Neoarius graeffei]
MDSAPAVNVKNVLYVAYLIAALDVTWLFLQISITPYLARRLGFDSLWFGYLQTTIGMIQLLGGPVFGRFADIFGARAALSLSCLASVIYFLLLAAADSAFLLFLHKLPAVFMHAFPGLQMVVTDLSENNKRADALAKLGLYFGIGMITGSLLGGTLSTRFGEKFAAYVGSGGSVINLVLVLKFIPKHTKRQNTKNNNTGSVFKLGEIVRLMKFPGVAKTFTVKIIAGLPSGVFQVMFSIIVMNFFQLQAEENGYLMAYLGIVQMVIQGAVIGHLTARYSENSLLLFSIGLNSLVGLAQALTTNMLQFCFVVIPMMLSISIFNVITDSMLTKSVPAFDTGAMLGLCASVLPLVRTIGPTIGGFLYETYGVASFGYIQFTVSAITFSLLFMSNTRRNTAHYR